LLDQCLGRSKTVTVEVVNETAGLVGREHLFELTDAIKQRDSGSALEIIDKLHNSSKDMARLCEEFSVHLRNLMLIKTMKDAHNMIVVSDTEYENITKQALSIPLPAILHGLDTIQSALERMYRGGDRRIEFEMAMIRLCSPELDSTADALIRRLDALERGIVKPQPAKPQPVKATQSVNEPVENIAVPSRANTTAVIEESSPKPGRNPAEAMPQKEVQALQGDAERLAEWPEILQILKTYSHVIASAFNGSTAYISGAYVLIDAPNEIAFRLLRETAQRDNMRNAIQQVTGKTYKLGPYKKPGEKENVSDPLAELAGLAENEGIEVIKN